jgi:hypothetical protein
MGWRITTTPLPQARSRRTTRRVVWLLPLPVRTAHTDTTGTFDLSMVLRDPRSLKSAPAASTIEALCISVSWDTSL